MTEERMDEMKVEEAVYRDSAPVSTSEEKMAQAVYTNTSPQSERKKGMATKTLIAVALVCSLLGGAVGSAVTIAMTGGNNLSIPEGSAPIQVVAGDASPVVAIVDTVSPSIVGVTTYGQISTWYGAQGTGQLGSGSGIIFRQDGYIITNNHVVSGGTSFEVNLADGTTYSAKLVGADSATDLAVLKVEATGLPAATLGNSDELQIGELAVAIGNPLGFANTVTDGIISGLNRQSMEGYEQKLSLIQTNAAINNGNSGGALVNSKGEVVGICSVKLGGSGVEGMGFAITINDAKPIIEELMNNGYVSRPYIGITGGSVTKEFAQYYQLNISHGIFVQEVLSNGPAAKGGIQPGDIIYKANDTILNGFEDLTKILDESKVGDKLHLLVDRNGNSVEIFVTLEEASQEALNRK